MNILSKPVKLNKQNTLSKSPALGCFFGKFPPVAEKRIQNFGFPLYELTILIIYSATLPGGPEGRSLSIATISENSP
jgi:hypothetical protein